jgi:LDH2 family malate/lactate/ureidoglycolate dehydrogenase
MELLTKALRSRDGIPIPDSTWASITDTAHRFGLAVPVPLTDPVSA